MKLVKVLSLIVAVVLWGAVAAALQSTLLPTPWAVGVKLVADTQSGELPFHVACTLARVAGSFTLALLFGLAVGYAMGTSSAVDRIGDPWLVIMLNLPALVTIIFAYIWIGLNETAAIIAVMLSKLPNVIVLTREGARALDPGLDDVATVFRFTWLSKMRHVVLPQLAPYVAAACRSGISIVWKIVLVCELIGRPNGVGFVLGTAFSLFDMVTIFAYSMAFIAIMLVIENAIMQPLERHANRWRKRAA